MELEVEEDGAAAGGLEEWAAGGGLEPGGASRDGEGETALDGIEVRPLCEGELELMTEWGASGRVVQGGSVGLLASLLQLVAPLGREVGVRVEGGVDRIRKEAVQIVVHQPSLLANASEVHCRGRHGKRVVDGDRV